MTRLSREGAGEATTCLRVGSTGNRCLNFSDPFGLCPPDDLDPCSSSDYYAIRLATGQGNQVLNEIGGALSSCGESLLCNAVLDLASLGATALERRAAAKVVEEGIYEFTTTSGETYVGQSGRITERLAEHVRAGRLAAEDAGKVARTEVRGGKVAREIAEQKRIDKLGGIKSGKLANKRNPIGPARRYLLDEE